MEAPPEDELARIDHFEVGLIHVRLADRNTSKDPACVFSYRPGLSTCFQKAGDTHEWAMGVGSGASGSSTTRSHSCTLPAILGGIFHSSEGILPMPSAVCSLSS